MKYHIIKSSRTYQGKPYCGESSFNTPLECDIMYDAFAIVEFMDTVNPVGWDVYDSHTNAKLDEKVLI